MATATATKIIIDHRWTMYQTRSEAARDTMSESLSDRYLLRRKKLLAATGRQNPGPQIWPLKISGLPASRHWSGNRSLISRVSAVRAHDPLGVRAHHHHQQRAYHAVRVSIHWTRPVLFRTSLYMSAVPPGPSPPPPFHRQTKRTLFTPLASAV